MPRRNTNARPKRVRIDETNNEEAPNSSSKSDKVSPTSKAKLELERRIASHPMDMQSHMKSLGLEILNHRRDYFNKKNIIKKMEDDASYIPQSARNKFKIEFSEATKARVPQRITELEAQAKAAVDAYQAAAKSVIIEACKEEKKTHLKHVQDSTCKAIHQITKTHIASLGITLDPHEMVSNLFAHINIAMLVDSIPGLNKNQLIAKYKSYHSLGQLPDPVDIPADPTEGMTNDQAGQIRQAQYEATLLPSMRQIDKLAEKLLSVIALPWKAFLDQHDENQRLLAVKKVSSELTEGQATDATAMLVDNEAPINAQQMQDIIAQAVKKATQPLQQQLNQQNKQLQALQNPSSKNSQRGSSNRKGSASNKKKSNSSNNSKKDNRTNRGRSLSNSSRSTTASRRPNNRRGRPKRRDSSVDDSASASSRSRSRQPRRRSTSKRSSNRKNRNSNRRSNRS